ncbi:hypothetical protein PQO03_21610 [Lentisphaera profundi]|uniref:Uncharacterized protein n=1 Tax=Lentisphaera profundi TaxID=1658616 RepID=A0ABY7VZW3_9BACT|nr:hypothetical protein [Lentisphaera profundi]WDE98412.1 hypothetical protein PQO03_21610 [Lentisphaera profundi]
MSLPQLKELKEEHFSEACEKVQLAYKVGEQLGERFSSYSNLLLTDMTELLHLGREALINYHLAPDESIKSKLKLLNILQLTMNQLKDESCDFLELKQYSKWKCNSARVSFVYSMSNQDDYSYKSYSNFIESNKIDKVANLLICLIDQAIDELDYEIHILERRIKRSMSLTKIKDKLSRV